MKTIYLIYDYSLDQVIRICGNKEDALQEVRNNIGGTFSDSDCYCALELPISPDMNINLLDLFDQPGLKYMQYECKLVRKDYVTGQD